MVLGGAGSDFSDLLLCYQCRSKERVGTRWLFGTSRGGTFAVLQTTLKP